MKAFAWVLIVMAIVAIALSGCTAVTGHGTKVGTVIKLSQEGLFCKTWEGELIRGGMSSGSGGFSTTPLHFTINDPALLRQVQDALDRQYEVEVTYTSYLGPFPCASGHGSDLFLTTLKHRE